MSAWVPVMRFDTDEGEFTRGFEAGRVYAQVGALLAEDVPPDEWCRMMPFTVHSSNVEMMLRIGERYGLNVTSVELGDDWLDVTFRPGD